MINGMASYVVLDQSSDKPEEKQVSGEMREKWAMWVRFYSEEKGVFQDQYLELEQFQLNSDEDPGRQHRSLQEMTDQWDLIAPNADDINEEQSQCGIQPLSILDGILDKIL